MTAFILDLIVVLFFGSLPFVAYVAASEFNRWMAIREMEKIMASWGDKSNSSQSSEVNSEKEV